MRFGSRPDGKGGRQVILDLLHLITKHASSDSHAKCEEENYCTAKLILDGILKCQNLSLILILQVRTFCLNDPLRLGLFEGMDKKNDPKMLP